MTNDCTLTIKGVLQGISMNLTYRDIQCLSISNSKDIQPRYDMEGNLISYDVNRRSEFTITGSYLPNELQEIDKE